MNFKKFLYKDENKYTIIAMIILYIFFMIPFLIVNKFDNERLENVVIEKEIYFIHQTEPARITCYLWTGNPMANGEYPNEGMVASSDRSIPFGTEVIIDGKKYIVGDRTNKRFEEFNTQTMDLYWEDSLEDCLKFGVQYKDIAIINNK